MLNQIDRGSARAAAALAERIVADVVAPDELMDRARAKAEKLGAMAPHYVRMAKSLAGTSIEHTLTEHLQLERHGIADSMATEDLRNGVKFETDPSGELAYTTKSATAKAGEVTVEFNNPQALTHDVAIESSSGEEVGATELIAEGSDSTTVNLKPGTYHYFCTVPGHREAGMEGTLTVK